MSTITIARVRRAASVALAHVSCASHEATIARYGDGEFCRHCGVELRAETPGVADLDRRYANGEVDPDLYLETLDMLLGHP